MKVAELLLPMNGKLFSGKRSYLFIVANRLIVNFHTHFQAAVIDDEN